MSELQMQAVRIVPRCTAGLSVLGSGYILYSVLWTDNNCHRYFCCCCCCRRGGGTGENHDSVDDADLSNTQRRQQRKRSTTTSASRGTRRPRRRHHAILGRNLLVGMSVADLLSSCSYVIGDIAFPRDDGGLGNQSTCNCKCFGSIF